MKMNPKTIDHPNKSRKPIPDLLVQETYININFGDSHTHKVADAKDNGNLRMWEALRVFGMVLRILFFGKYLASIAGIIELTTRLFL